MNLERIFESVLNDDEGGGFIRHARAEKNKIFASLCELSDQALEIGMEQLGFEIGNIANRVKNSEIDVQTRRWGKEI